MEKVDIIYPLSNQSRWQDNELKYSLRSVEEFVNVGNIYVVGHKPAWLSDAAIHVDYQDVIETKKNHNIISKTLHAAKMSDSESFLMNSDDHIILNKPDFSPYYRGYLNDTAGLNDNDFVRSCHETYKYLSEKGLPTFNYEGHYPMKVDRLEFISIFEKIELYKNVGYVMYSMYFNHVGRFPMEPDLHVIRLRNMDLDHRAWMHTFLNFNDYALSDDLKRFLMQRFPNKSIYER